jgi:hypothetical protein
MSAPGWTVETLKEHFDQRFLDQQTAVNAALVSAEKAVTKAEVNGAEWRASSNEWRGAMTDRELKFATQEQIAALSQRVNQNQEALIKLQAGSEGGRSAKGANLDAWRMAFIALGGLIGIGVLAVGIFNALK